MARGKAARRGGARKAVRKGFAARSAESPTRAVKATRSSPRRAAGTGRTKGAEKSRSPNKSLRQVAGGGEAMRSKPSRLNRERRTLEELVPTPPSSLDMDRRGSAARTGRAELADSLHEHPGMTPTLTGGDVDANWENAYFSGDEAPGGDNPTPDQDVVEEIGRSLGVDYQDNEELKAVDKVTERDRKRWELDPASSEDYKDRK